jgi:hypothetical protein
MVFLMRKGIKDIVDIIFTASKAILHRIKISEGIISGICRNYRLLVKKQNN